MLLSLIALHWQSATLPCRSLGCCSAAWHMCLGTSDISLDRMQQLGVGT